jgi:hypothetical protein
VEDPSGQVFWNAVVARKPAQRAGKKLGRDGFTRGRPAHRFRPRAGGWPGREKRRRAGQRGVTEQRRDRGQPSRARAVNRPCPTRPKTRPDRIAGRLLAGGFEVVPNGARRAVGRLAGAPSRALAGPSELYANLRSQRSPNRP